MAISIDLGLNPGSHTCKLSYIISLSLNSLIVRMGIIIAIAEDD